MRFKTWTLSLSLSLSHTNCISALRGLEKNHIAQRLLRKQIAIHTSTNSKVHKKNEETIQEDCECYRTVRACEKSHCNNTPANRLLLLPRAQLSPNLLKINLVNKSEYVHDVDFTARKLLKNSWDVYMYVVL